MRTLKLAIYILAALATYNLSAAANASPSFMKEPDVKQSSPQRLNSSVLQLLSSTPQLPNPTNTKQFSKRASDLAQAATLSDIQGNWAESFIQALVARNIIQGFPDGTFRPEQPVTRAEFAAMLDKAFQKNSIREAVTFSDVPTSYWGSEAIQKAYQTGFLAGYPNNVFLPNQNIPRVQVLVSLANGLGLSTTTAPTDILTNSFQDAAQIPDFARTPVAAATANRLVVNYPNVALLNPNQVATRADVAAFIYQGLASAGTVPQLSATDVASSYIVGYQPPTTTPSSGAAPTTPQQTEDLRAQFRLPLPPVIEVVRVGVFSGTTIASPTAFGVQYGDAFIGASLQSRTRRSHSADGTAAVGFGLGDARRYVGLETVLALVDLSDPFQDGTVSFKLHRLITKDFAVAIGFENAIRWGSPDGGSSIYGVASKVFTLDSDFRNPLSRLTVSVGVGSDRFRSESDIRRGNDGANVFGSVGLQVIEPASLIADWTGQDLSLGISVIPFRGVPLVITPAVADVTGNAGDGPRFVLGAGYAIRF